MSLQHWFAVRLMLISRNSNNNNDNIIITGDSVYGAVIMTQVISRVHPVHLTNVGQRQAAADIQIRQTDLGLHYMAYILHR